ncbi:MAG: hypothetical protein Q8K64_09345 [Sediminibacterium sp.]|nr:hypothetical protein [Sediminibacterium sp.]
MRLIFTITSLLVLSFQLPAQKITGIWRGYFSASNGLYREGVMEEMYKYEIQIQQLSNNSIKGVTYSYKTTVFYGKATLQGIYNVQSKTLLLKETGLLDLKVGDKSEPCLMTCYLDYSKMEKLETFQGTFISTNIKDKGDCGSGKVYLEKVPVSDFKKEEFLKKPQPDSVGKPANSAVKKQGIIKDTVTKKTAPANTIPLVKKPSQKVNNIPKQAITNTKKKVTPLTKSPELPTTARTEEKIIQQPVKPKEAEVAKTNMPIPKVLLERENNLVRTIITDEENIQIDLFDNGTIDNDTISVYHNNALVIKHGRLASSPISVKIKNTPEDDVHELVVVAENLGEIPPNTALMVITAGKKRYEIFLASNEERNAKVVIKYIPKKL